VLLERRRGKQVLAEDVVLDLSSPGEKFRELPTAGDGRRHGPTIRKMCRRCSSIWFDDSRELTQEKHEALGLRPRAQPQRRR
jgi:hypothetical protein